MRDIAILITCHNRKDKTISCLRSLFSQTLPQLTLHVWLVDDGSTDGTSAAIREQFPNVRVINGSGNLYWTGGMRLCWQHALQSKPDFYLWVNDDVSLQKNAVARLVECFDNESKSTKPIGAIIGTMQDPVNGVCTYGGRRANNKWFPMHDTKVIEAQDIALECDYLNGNFCLVPASAVDVIGIFSERFTHKMGDFDYSFRLRRAGFKLLIAPQYYGFCAAHPIHGSIKDTTIPLEQRRAMLTNPTNCPPLNEWLYFLWQYGGPFWPLLCIKAILGRLFPKLWLLFHQRRY